MTWFLLASAGWACYIGQVQPVEACDAYPRIPPDHSRPCVCRESRIRRDAGGTRLVLPGDPDAVFHVAPAGNDRSAGDASHPYASLERACQAVQQFRASHPALTDSVFILVHGGRYTLTAPLRLGPGVSGTAASPTVIAAAPGESPVVSGGEALRKWSRTTLDGKSVWVASLSARMKKIRPEVRELWVNGERRSPARFPKTGYLAVDSIPDHR